MQIPWQHHSPPPLQFGSLARAPAPCSQAQTATIWLARQPRRRQQHRAGRPRFRGGALPGVAPTTIRPPSRCSAMACPPLPPPPLARVRHLRLLAAATAARPKPSLIHRAQASRAPATNGTRPPTTTLAANTSACITTAPPTGDVTLAGRDAANPGSYVPVDPPMPVAWPNYTVQPVAVVNNPPVIVAEVEAPEPPEAPERYGNAHGMKFCSPVAAHRHA